MATGVPPSSIGDEIFFDRNGDGVRNQGEGLAGVTVGLDVDGDGVADRFAITAADGTYLFANLTIGTYKVIVDTSTLPGGIAYANTKDPDGASDSMSVVSLGIADDNRAQDFAYRAFDFGDAPDSYGTSSGASVARHVISVGQSAATPALFLGAVVDAESTGAASAGADGDDSAGGDDEDGIQFLTAIQAGQTAQIRVTVREAAGVDGRLSAWIDFNRDGDFSDSGERIFSDVAVNDGAQTLSFTAPAGASAGETYARFRLSTDLGLAATGDASNGEVEDYKIAIQAAPVGSIGNEVFFDKNGNGVRDAGEGFAGVTVRLDRNNDGTIDATATTDANGVYLFSGLAAGTYKVMVDTATLPGGVAYANTADPDGGSNSMSLVNLAAGQDNLAQDFGYRAFDYGDAPSSYGTAGATGARHVISVGQTAATPSLHLGAKVDAESDGVPSAGANGDDGAGADDEDGIQFLTTIEAGKAAKIQVTVAEAAGVDGRLSGWIDFNRDGDFNDAGEKIFSDVAVANGTQTLSFTAAANAVAGDTYARFRLSTDLGLGATGQASNGEVEDYKVAIAPKCVPVTFDFQGNSALDGTDGNSRYWADAGTGTTVTARAFSQTKGADSWQKAWLGAYGGGLGVTDSSEGSGSGNAHTVDNVGRNNYIVFQFSQAVILDKAYLGYVVNDSDMQIWIGNRAGPITTMSNAVLAELGYSEINGTTSSSARWADLNANEVQGNTIVIAADTTDTTPEDYFKLQKLVVCATPVADGHIW